MLPADQLTATLLDYIVEDMGLAAGARVALLVNGLGATPQMELDVVMRAAYDKLAARHRRRAGLVGHAAVGAGHAGLLAVAAARGRRPPRCWTRPRARAPGRAAGGSTRTSTSPRRRWSRARPRADAAGQRCSLKPALGGGGGAARQGADADRAGFAGGRRRPGRQHEARRRRHPGGARRGPGRSGRRAGRAGRRAAQGHRRQFRPVLRHALLRARAGWREARSARDWAGAFSDAVQAVSDLGGAKAGDRTMLDALFPAAAAFEQGLAQGATPAVAFAAAVEAAEQGAQATAAMRRAPAAPAIWASAPSVRRTAAPWPWPAGWRLRPHVGAV